MEGTSSLSKGCFLFNEASSSAAPSVLTGSFQVLPGETASDAVERAEVYTRQWSWVQENIQDIMTNHHDLLLSDLVRFVTDAAAQLCRLSRAPDTHQERETLLPPPRLEIPSAVVVAGVNMPDHKVLFKQLKLKITAAVTPYVVLLHSASCSAGMKSTWKEILLQLINLSESELALEDADEEGVLSQQRLPLPSLSLLHSWYQETLQTSTNRSQPVVIIIEDFEGFPPHILQDLFMSISPHLATLPVVLILNVCTSSTAIHSLPRSSSSLLCVEQFTAASSMETLTHVIEKVLLFSERPFRLGPQALKFLLRQFICTSLSVSQLSHTLQVAILEHFHWQSLSILIGRWDSLDSSVAALNHDQCEMIRATPSFRKYVDRLEEDPERQIELLTNDHVLKEVVKAHLRQLRVHQKTFPLLLLCLHTLTESLPSAPLGKKLHDVYLLCMERPVMEHDQFDMAWNLLRAMGRDGLSRAVGRCIVILLKSHIHSRGEAGSPVSRALHVFQKFLAELDKIDSQTHLTTEVDKEREGGAMVGEVQTTSERKMRFQERLRQIASRKREPSHYERARTTLLDELLLILQEGLTPAHTLPLHEICYFNNASSLRKHLSPSPRASLHVALTKPTYYLPSAASVSEDTTLSPHMPDVCIAYQLHLECGRLINLFDWLCAFVAVVDPEAAGKLANQEGGKGSKEDIDPTLHARFIQAVSELQLLGFVKPTQRKTDHVQRLTWGAC